MIDRTDFERRFKAHILGRLLVEGSQWTEDEAKAVADNEWENWEDDYSPAGDPEHAAEECLSYWDADE